VSQPLTTTLRQDSGLPVLEVVGEVDMATAPQLRAALSKAAAQHAKLAVDLTKVSYLDSAGIRVLYDHTEAVVELVVAEESVITRVLTVAGLDALFATPPPGAAR
jgi:anti-sigma B factor antagonist